MFSYLPGSAAPGSSILDQDSHAVPDPIAGLLTGDLTNIRYLVEIYPYDKSIASNITLHPAPLSTVPGSAITAQKYGDIGTVRLSDHVFITEPDDVPSNTPFIPLVETALTYDMSVWRGDTIGLNTSSYGSIEVSNYSGELDGLVSKSFAGRRVVVKAGYDGFRYDDYATVFDGLANGLEYDDRGIILTISDRSLLMDKLIITPLYDGTGGLAGNSDLTGVMKPISLGKCFNIEPVLVDATNLIYQAHAWSMESVDAVYDAGVGLSFDADYPDITSANPGHGEYATCLATGHIKLGSTPVGRITANVQGDNDGGYVEELGAVCKRIGTKLYDYLSFHPDDYADNWGNLADSVGLYIRESATMRQLLDTLMNPCAAYWYFDRLGTLSARYINTAATSNASISTALIDTAGAEMIQQIPPAWKITVAYAPVWTVQNESEMAGAATDTQRQFVGNQYRLVTSEDRNLRGQFANPIERTFYTNLTDKADAEALLARMVSLYGKERRIYRGVGYEAAYRIRLGDVVGLSYDRYGIGGQMLVVGIGEDARTGQTSLELFA